MNGDVKVLEAARDAFAALNGYLPKSIKDGRYDNHQEMKVAIAAINEYRARSGEKWIAPLASGGAGC